MFVVFCVSTTLRGSVIYLFGISVQTTLKVRRQGIRYVKRVGCGLGVNPHIWRPDSVSADFGGVKSFTYLLTYYY